MGARTSPAFVLAAIGAGLGLFLAAGPRAHQAIKVDEIVARNHEAHGGLDRIKAVQSLRITGRVRAQALQGTLTSVAKRPNLLRQEITFGSQTIVTGFDGSTAWMVNPLTGSSAPAVLSGPDEALIRLQAEFDSPLVDASARGYAVELVGTETLAGKPVFHLAIAAPGKTPQHCYLDSQTFLEVRVTSTGTGASVDQDSSDYRATNGLRFPYVIRSLSGGVVLSELSVQRIELNPRVDDSTFKMPLR